MWEEEVLLKIKRDFTESESVKQLLKIISELETEIGILKSERDEADDLAEKLRKLPTMTKKQWLQDEVFFDLKHEAEVLDRKNKEHKKKMEDWRNQYFTLLAKTDKAKIATISSQEAKIGQIID